MIWKGLWDQFTDRYSLLIIHPQYYLKKYNYTAIAKAEKYARGDLLDIGCGRMPYKNRLLPHIKSYTGVDSPAVSKLYTGPNKPDIYADAVSIPLKDNSYDTILLLQVIEHLPQPQDAIDEAMRLLRKDGILIISTVQSYPIHDEPYDFFRYTIYGMKQLLLKHKHKSLEVISEGNIFVEIFQHLNVYLMLRIKSLINNKYTLWLALPLLIIILPITLLNNLITYPLQFIDKKSKFGIINTLIIKKS